MSELTDRLHRRTARIAFGSVLLAGVALLIFETPAYLQQRGPSLPAASIIAVTWLLAIVAYGVAYHARPPHCIERLRIASLVIPALGTVTLLPITFHMPVALALGGSRGFDFWCGLSVFVAAAAQTAIGALTVERVRAIAAGRVPRRLRTVYLVTVVAALIPSVVAALIVAVTALPILGAIRELERIAATERESDVRLPTAIARSLS